MSDLNFYRMLIPLMSIIAIALIYISVRAHMSYIKMVEFHNYKTDKNQDNEQKLESIKKKFKL